MEEAFLKYLDTVEDFEYNDEVLDEKCESIEEEDIKKIEEEISKLKRKQYETTELFSSDDIDYDTFKQIKNVIDKKLEILYKELDNFKSNIEPNKSLNIDKIKQIIVNLKSNFISLSNREKKMFLERFVKFIEVEKINDEVIIKKVEF